MLLGLISQFWTINRREAEVSMKGPKIFAILYLSVFLLTFSGCQATPTGISLAEYSLELETGDNYTLDYALEPNGASGTVVFTSSDYSVVNIIDGKLVAVSAGNATITATVGNNITTACNVLVKNRPALEQLSEKEKSFYNVMISIIKYFNVPSSVRVVRVKPLLNEKYLALLSAQNKLGTTLSGTYSLSYGSVEESSQTISSSDSDINIDLINQAIEEYWS